MTKRRWFSVVFGAIVLGGACLLPAAVASADVVTPPGACTASGQWQTAGLNDVSTDFEPSSVIKVPQRDRVSWQGHEHGEPLGYFGATRPIDGALKISLPYGLPDVTIWHWGGHDSARYSNAGQKSYHLPAALIGIKLKLSGFEKDSGTLVCSGSVYVEVTGSKTKNPIGWVAIGGALVTLLLTVTAGFRKSRFAYDDLNP
jgi:hypothetical protein